MQSVKQIRVHVSDMEQAILVERQGALPVFSLENTALSIPSRISLADLPESFPFAVLMNSPIPQSQLAQAEQLVRDIWANGAQWLYFSDPAVLRFCSQEERKKCIYRPEMLATSIADGQFWLDQGIGEVSVSPLLTREETVQILHALPHAELTIHGHVLLSVSRRRLLSAWKEQYGADLEPMHNPHLTLRETTRQECMPVYETEAGTMIFSDYVLESFDYMNDFRDAEAMYIEGAFLTAEAIVQAVSLYQRLLSGESAEAEIQAYRAAVPDSSRGYYDQKTIL